MLHQIDIPRDGISDFCRRWHIRKLAFFGSVLTDEFGPDSDVDVLVEFAPSHVPGLEYVDAQEELSRILGRKVHLSTPSFISRRFRDRVVGEAHVAYAD